jgi:protein involved in polysaccharide export with SLBB domain
MLKQKYVIRTLLVALPGAILGCSSGQLMKKNGEASLFKIPLYRNETQMPEYQIGIGDELEIKFFDNEKFNELVIVRPDGRITLQRVDDLYVNGMTPSELDQFITNTYSKIIKSPDISVFVRKTSGKQIYLSGEVKMPGAYLLHNGMTLVQALALARWETEDANLKSVILLRRTDETTMVAEKVNLKKMLSYESPGSDYVLQADDVIYVPKTMIANLGKFIRDYYDILLPPWQAFWQIQYIEARIND